LRTKPAHFVGHLPDNEDYRNSAILAFLLAQETAWKAIKWVLRDKIAIEVAGPKPVLQEAFLQGWLGSDETVCPN